MSSFATDRVLIEDDRRLITAAAGADPRAVEQVCERFKIPVWAILISTTGDWQLANSSVRPVLVRLCRELLDGILAPRDWPMRAYQFIEFNHAAVGATAEPAAGLSGLPTVPRIIQRRVVRQELARMPIPRLTAMLLRYVAGMSPADMVGLAVDSEQQAYEELWAGHESLVVALQTASGSRDGTIE